MINSSSLAVNVTSNDKCIENERLIIGSLYLIFGIIFFTLLCCCLYIMLTKKKVFHLNSSHQYNSILRQIILADVIQIFFSGIITGLFVLMPTLSSTQWLSTVCGALAYGAWFLYSFSANLLAFNRFIHIVYDTKVGQIFSTKLTKRYLFALYVYSFIWILVLISPPINIQFNCDFNTYVCNRNDIYCFWMSRAALVFDWVNVACICFFYIVICIKVRIQIRNHNKTLHQMNQLKTEAKVIYQSLLICLGSVTYVFIFFLPIDKTELIMEIDHFVWIFLSGTNSLILLTINGNMKEQFRLLIGGKPTATVTVVSTRKLEIHYNNELH